MAEQRHIVALSGGKDSTCLAIELSEREPRDYEYVCTPTGNELPTMVDHWVALGERLGTNIKPIGVGQSLGQLIRKQNALPNWQMRWCTRMLKIEPFQAYLLSAHPCTVYVGIRADETSRDGVDWEELGGVTLRYPLVEWGYNRACVIKSLKDHDIVVPDRTDCAACFFQTLYEWYRLWLDFSEQYGEAEEWERLTGHTLRSPSRDSRPASLRLLRVEFEKGYRPKPKKMDDRTAMCSVCSR